MCHPVLVGFELHVFHSQILGESSLVSDWEQKLVLWCSMPSPCPKIGKVLHRLIGVCNLKVARIPRRLCPPGIIPLNSCAAPLASNSVYVGSGCKAFPIKPSIWLNPFAACPSGGLELYRAYVQSRPDLHTLWALLLLFCCRVRLLDGEL